MVDLLLGATEPSLAEAFSKAMRGNDDLTDTQVTQFSNYALARFFHAEDSFYQHREGLLNDFYFEGIAYGLKNSLSSASMRALYRRHRRAFGRDFAEFIDELLNATPISASGYLWAQFKEDTAAETALAPTG